MDSLGRGLMDELAEAIKTVIDAANLRVEAENGSSILKNGDKYVIQAPDGGCYESDFNDIYRLWKEL